MSRYYLCEQNITSSITCQYYSSLHHILQKDMAEYKSFCELSSFNISNVLPPICDKVVSVYKIPNYIPIIFDHSILQWRLFQWPKVFIDKK